MSHIIYQTEGIVMGKKDFGEADRILTIFTEKFGKINALAQGVRYLKSKLRYNLDSFSRSRIGLVSGKEFWRIVDAEEISSAGNILFAGPGNLKILSNVFSLLDRMVQGEERNETLWQEIRNLTLALGEKNLSKNDLENLEIFSLLRIFHNLGYIDAEKYNNKKEAILIINKAIKESML